MARQYGNALRKEIYENAHEDALTPSEGERGVKTPSRARIAFKCLSVVPAKRIADVLNVAVRTVQKWASGEVSIPAKHIGAIEWETLSYLEPIQRELMTDLLLTYGSQNGHAARGDF